MNISRLIYIRVQSKKKKFKASFYEQELLQKRLSIFFVKKHKSKVQFADNMSKLQQSLRERNSNCYVSDFSTVLK